MDKLKAFIYFEVYENTKKGKAFIKKYNLSLNDIHVLFLITAGQCKQCFYFNLLPVLDEYGIKYKIDEDNVCFELLEEEEKI